MLPAVSIQLPSVLPFSFRILWETQVLAITNDLSITSGSAILGELKGMLLLAFFLEPS